MSHSSVLIRELRRDPRTEVVQLTKDFGKARNAEVGPFDGPQWNWGRR